MRFEVIEIGQHVRVETGEVVHALFVRSDAGHVFEVPIDAELFGALMQEMGETAVGRQEQPAPEGCIAEPARMGGPGVPPGFESVFAGFEDEPPPNDQPPDYVDRAVSGEDEDGFGPDD